MPGEGEIGHPQLIDAFISNTPSITCTPRPPASMFMHKSREYRAPWHRSRNLVRPLIRCGDSSPPIPCQRHCSVPEFAAFRNLNC
jgi:hypothetical protein